MMRLPILLLVTVAVLCSCGADDPPTWTHRLHADNIQFLSVPGFDALPPQEKNDIWRGRQYTFAPTDRAQVVSTHGRWTRVKVPTSVEVVTVYVPTETVSALD